MPGFQKSKKKSQNQKSDDCYDLKFDAVLIEQSIAKQYQIIPSEQKELSHTDWVKLVSGLMEDTPLGKVVTVRMETDKDVIKNMTRHELQIRQEWEAFKLKKALENPQDLKKEAEALERMIASAFG